MFSPQLKSPNPNHAFSPNLLHSPNPSSSPYRLPPIPKSSSGNDLVSGIVEKFNSLAVTDRDEEKAKYERQIQKLRAALDRATMAREEAEEEARRLREKLLEVQDERVRERDALRAKVGEFEKKYEKAKDRFKMQRARNEEAMRNVQGEILEKEKEHWRGMAVVQEVEEWERRLRVEAMDLVDFLELERMFEVDALRRRKTAGAVEEVRRVKVVVECDAAVDMAVDEHEDETEIPRRPLLPRAALDEVAIDSRPVSRGTDEGQPRPNSRNHITAQESLESLREVTPEGPPSMPIRPFATPAKQVIRVPVDFGEDKENREPTVAEILKTPMTMDRAAALAAIEYRRGRAKSFMNAQMTPKTLSLIDKRDVSAPAVVTMSVGRKR